MQPPPAQPTPHPATRTPPAIAAQVEEQTAILMDIPESVGAAHRDYKEVLPFLVKGAQDLDKGLAALLTVAPPRSAVPASIKAPGGRAAELRFLARMLEGGEVDRLMMEVRAQWNAWSRFLVDAGLARLGDKSPASAARPLPDPWRREDEEVLRRLKRMQANSLHESDMEDLRAFCTSPTGEFDLATYRALNPKDLNYSLALSQVVQMAVASRAQAPRFREAWEPLTAYLKNSAAAWTELEARTGEDPGPEMKALWVHARLRFMDQLRTSLWFCHHVWARMSGNPAPPPLARFSVK